MSAETVVHVIDDDEAVRDSLAFLLETADLTVRTHDSAQRFLDQASGATVSCVITDIRMPQMTGLELVHRLNALGLDLPVIVITGHADVPLAVEAMRAGVVDFIEKPFDDQTILAALKSALSRGHDQHVRAAERGAIVQRLSSLSTRERQVLNGLVAGQSNKAVARVLAISPRTVEVYRANLMTKMNAESLSDLVRMALTAEGKA
jgi:two-component system response regulator FixJ